ncbi:unnamed protein product, partial [Porites lobata]
RDEWLTKGQVQSFFSRLSAISRKKRADQSREYLLSVLLQEEIAFLIDERRDKEVEHIFNKMGVIHPIRHDGHDICEQTNQE